MAQVNIFNNFYSSGALGYSLDISDKLQALAVNQSNMLAINGGGGVKCWSIPTPCYDDEVYYHNTGSPLIFKASCIFFAVGDWSQIPADSPETFSFTLNGSTVNAYVSPDSSGRVELPLYKEGEAEPAVILEASEMKGVATFDVAPIVGTWYEEPNVTFISGVKEATDVSLRFNVPEDITGEGNSTFFCVRGVNPAGINNAGVNIASVEVLTATRIFWENGLNIITVVMGEDMDISIPPYFYYTMEAGHAYHLLVNILGATWINNNILGDDNDHVTVKTCWAESKYYVTWLNQAGGYEAYLFTKLQMLNEKASNKQMRQVYNDYSRPVLATQKPFDVEHSVQIVLGAENVSQKQFEMLRTLAISPCIIHHTNSDNVQVCVADYNNRGPLQSGGQSFELTVAIPTSKNNF